MLLLAMGSSVPVLHGGLLYWRGYEISQIIDGFVSPKEEFLPMSNLPSSPAHYYVTKEIIGLT